MPRFWGSELGPGPPVTLQKGGVWQHSICLLMAGLDLYVSSEQVVSMAT